jgi:hypothetical protein
MMSKQNAGVIGKQDRKTSFIQDHWKIIYVYQEEQGTQYRALGHTVTNF